MKAADFDAFELAIFIGEQFYMLTDIKKELNDSLIHSANPAARSYEGGMPVSNLILKAPILKVTSSMQMKLASYSSKSCP